MKKKEPMVIKLIEALTSPILRYLSILNLIMSIIEHPSKRIRPTMSRLVE